jgi:hypothetical protein
MAVMQRSVQLVVEDQRRSDPGVTASQALEHVLRNISLRTTHGTDPVSRAYVAVLRHPRQARFDAKEIERHERHKHD